MGKYCDAKVLEATWSAWILASKTPVLDDIRSTGLLFTLDRGITLRHRVVSNDPYSFESKSGAVAPTCLQVATRASFLPLDPKVARQAAERNYLLELPVNESWDKLSSMIYQICCGVVLNFHPPAEDCKNELVHEAYTHTMTKISRGKLVFTPGRAPVFNLLTTAIFRIMYSIKNKEKRDRDHRSDFVEDLLSGKHLPNLNSVNVSKSLVGYANH